MGLYHFVCVFLLSMGVSSTLLSWNPTREQRDGVFEEAFRFNAGMTTHGECLFVHLPVTPISAHSVAIHIVFPSTIRCHINYHHCVTMMGFQPISCDSALIPHIFRYSVSLCNYSNTLQSMSIAKKQCAPPHLITLYYQTDRFPSSFHSRGRHDFSPRRMGSCASAPSRV